MEKVLARKLSMEEGKEKKVEKKREERIVEYVKSKDNGEGKVKKE
jgi:hypothetical protein